MKFFEINLLLVTMAVFGLALAAEEKDGAKSVEDEVEDIDPESMDKRGLDMEDEDELRSSQPRPNYHSIKLPRCPHQIWPRQQWPIFPPEPEYNSCNTMEPVGRMCRQDFRCCYTFGEAALLRCVHRRLFPGRFTDQAEAIFP